MLGTASGRNQLNEAWFSKFFFLYGLTNLIRMESISKYFQAEKKESLFFILAGLLAIGMAAYFLLKAKPAFYTGMSYPLVGIALIELVVGVSVFLRSPKDIERVQHMLQYNKPKIASEEIPRMELVMKKFKRYKQIEIALMITGLALFLYFPAGHILAGTGLGLLLQAGLMLLLDFFAEQRGEAYLAFLQSIN